VNNHTYAKHVTCVFWCVLPAGQRDDSRPSRCQCSNGFTKIQGSMLRKPHQFHVHHPTNFCPNTEIILTLAGGKKKCVDPKSRLGGLALKQDR
uniref:Chemokine interleukin-8-like domain-containing protein n=1 Tax=Salarias fasciatus TaxID=181472 RepID=A0A672HPA6_SALFA